MKKNYYVDPKELRQELIDYVDSCLFKENGKIWKKGIMSERLGEMIVSIVKRLGTKKNWSNYSYLSDMIAEGIIMNLKYCHNFKKDDPKSNAFAYIDLIAQRAFMQYLAKQKKHSLIKQQLFDKKDDLTVENYAQKAIDYEDLNTGNRLDL